MKNYEITEIQVSSDNWAGLGKTLPTKGDIILIDWNKRRRKVRIASTHLNLQGNLVIRLEAA
jgi:hypothetical protein